MAREITLENITSEEIVEMAKTIQQYEQLVKDQQGYILQLQTQLKQRTQQLAYIRAQQDVISNFVEVEGKLDLE